MNGQFMIISEKAIGDEASVAEIAQSERVMQRTHTHTHTQVSMFTST